MTKDAVGWVEDQIDDRGSALVVLRMMDSMQLIELLDASAEAGVKLQDDASVYGVEPGRFRLWDHLLSLGKNFSDGDLGANSLTLMALLEPVLISLNPRGLSEEQLQKRLEELGQVASLAQTFLLMARDTPNRVETQVAQEWLVMYGQLSHHQAIQVLRAMSQAGLLASAAFPEICDLVSEDVALLLNCVSSAFQNQRGRHVKLWNRWSIVHLLIGEVPATGDTQAIQRSEYGLPEMQSEQFCSRADFHASVQAYSGRGRTKPLEHWLLVWKRLEEAEFLNLKQILRYDAATETLTEPHFWYVGSLGVEFLLEHTAHIPSLISFPSAASATLVDSRMSSPQPRFFNNITRRVNSGRHRRSGEFDSPDSDSQDQRSPRAKLLARNRKTPTAPIMRTGSSGLQDMHSKRSGDWKAATEENELNSTSTPDLTRTDSAPSVLSARPPRHVSPRQATFLSRQRTNSSEERRNMPAPSTHRSANTRASRTHSGSSTEIPKVNRRSNSNAGL